MSEDRRCTYVVNQATGDPCHSMTGRTWLVHYRIGTGWYLVKEPHVRCSKHVAETVAAYAADTYENGYLDHVEPLVPVKER